MKCLQILFSIQSARRANIVTRGQTEGWAKHMHIGYMRVDIVQYLSGELFNVLSNSRRQLNGGIIHV